MGGVSRKDIADIKRAYARLPGTSFEDAVRAENSADDIEWADTLPRIWDAHAYANWQTKRANHERKVNKRRLQQDKNVVEGKRQLAKNREWYQ